MQKILCLGIRRYKYFSGRRNYRKEDERHKHGDHVFVDQLDGIRDAISGSTGGNLHTTLLPVNL